MEDLCPGTVKTWGLCNAKRAGVTAKVPRSETWKWSLSSLADWASSSSKRTKQAPRDAPEEAGPGEAAVARRGDDRDDADDALWAQPRVRRGRDARVGPEEREEEKERNREKAKRRPRKRILARSSMEFHSSDVIFKDKFFDQVSFSSENYKMSKFELSGGIFLHLAPLEYMEKKASTLKTNACSMEFDSLDVIFKDKFFDQISFSSEYWKINKFESIGKVFHTVSSIGIHVKGERLPRKRMLARSWPA